MERPNLILKDTCTPEPFTSGGRVIKRAARKPDRVSHGRRLQTELDGAFKKDEARKAHAVAAREGTYLEFIGAKHYDLITKSLEDTRQGIRLLNVRVESDVEYATVFIPHGKEKVFLNKVRKYSDPNQLTKGGNVPNERLVASIEDIRLAIVDSLWTGDPRLVPNEERRWVEVWLRSATDEKGDTFSDYCALLDKLGIGHKTSSIVFPERVVTLVRANKDDLAQLLDCCDCLAEFREAPLATSFFINLEPKEQREWIDDLLARTTFEEGAARICVLDTGVNGGNPLLAPIVDTDVMLSHDGQPSPKDNDGHGTGIAGIAAYGDLKGRLASSELIEVRRTIESVKILDLSHQKDPELYGEIAKRSIDRASIAKPADNRIFCSGVTAEPGELTDGMPTSWSAALDEAISHADDPSEGHELFLVSGGNITTDMMRAEGYPEANENRSVRSPGQAWNALTIGGYAEHAEIEEEGILATGYEPAAKPGDISPYSTTSLQWQKKAPIKPEIMLPGGNVICKNGDYSDCLDFSSLTTGADVASHPLEALTATSAAVAHAAWMAAELENAYPELWPETIRGLMVHSARWSDAMLDRYCPNGESSTKRDRLRLLKACGYGIPSLERAIECRENSVNLIIQGALQPYELRNGSDSMHEMHLHKLPWPKEVLRDLGATPATLHITLSYYIEPGPGRIGWKDRYRYASHGLRFDVNKEDETRQEFEHRINVNVRAEDENKITSGSGKWYLGPNSRDVGSIHSDYKFVSAVELCDVEYVAVYPVIGWWRSRKYLGKINSQARYSLIVSIETPATDVDLYSEITNKIAVNSPIVIPT